MRKLLRNHIVTGVRMTFVFNDSDLRRLLSQAVTDKTNRLNDEFRNTLQSPLFSGYNTTYRRNGDVVENPRDAVDTAALLNSAKVDRITDYHSRITWDKEYAAKIFDHADVDLIEYTAKKI
jgi:hypothetical protein